MPTAPTRLPSSATVLFTMLAIVEIQGATPPEPAPAPLAPSEPRPEPTRADLNRFWSRENLDDAELAGLPKGTPLATLDWERAYTLALIQARAPHPAGGRVLARTLDSNDLAEQA